MQSPGSRTAAPFPESLRGIAYFLIWAGCVGYLFLLTHYTGTYAAGSDSSGYMNNARLLREGRTHEPQRAIEGLPSENVSLYTYVPLGYRPTRGNEMAPTYPIGLPLLIAGMSYVVGPDDAATAAIWLHAAAGIVLVFLLALEFGLPRHFAALGALILALSPLYLFSSVQVMSDMPALVWTTAAVVFAWRGTSRNSKWLIAGAGAAFAVAVLVRPSNFLMIAPLAIALGIDWRRWLAFGLGGLPGAIILGIYNWAAYGAIFVSGYGDISGLLQTDVAQKTVIHYAWWLPILMTPIAALALAFPWMPSVSARGKLVLIAWFVAIAAFYTFYFFTHESWWALRFVLPVFPAVIVASLVVLRHLSGRITIGPPRWFLGIVLVVAVVVWLVPWNYKLRSYRIGRGEGVYLDTANWVTANLPQDGVIMCMQVSGCLLFYTDRTFIRWDMTSPEDVRAIDQTLQAAGRPLYAILYDFEIEPALKKPFDGEWKQIDNVRHVTIWKRILPAND